ncbi:MAG: imidazoleglycerol-phosphate dehydratase [Thermovirgaceae bacterium]|jgi:imidazoleglycerol-phosphate dehydratase|nr:imidazoleglycerol-phosphate dehydratase [Synergistales bacterium]MDI9391753.1 imidazoleglycerol-phosphate dehydratase [Synergistota bacterium]MDY0179138.1 imidazoleglycerol-phosphate dehydratase [Synergistaceae bacterium]HRW88065.1 imidazoleglycerol-phosphate dehydratase [Thermovirgaceae bacterium]MDD3133536.1 imidazoleglycerol-phosphate dehydratase [Synergistales bacterium]
MPNEFERTTAETSVRVSFETEPGTPSIKTPCGFFSHMLELLGANMGWSLSIEASGREGEDLHHIVEDVGIALGRALFSWYPSSPRARYGWCALPMDGSLALISVDLSGRGGCYFRGSFPSERCGDLDLELVPEFFSALARESRTTIHARLLEADNSHHAAEALFKATGRAFAQAFIPSQTSSSTKGVWP